MAKPLQLLLQRAPEIDAIYPGKFASKVEVVLKDGRSLWFRVDYPKGSPENPMISEEVAEKFKTLARTAKGEGAISSILDYQKNLEKLPNLLPLIAQLS